jgi:hypothetical protein
MTTASLSRYDPIKGCFVLKDLDPKPPASPFEYMRFTEEEKARRGGKSLMPASDYIRSEAATKAVDKKRETNPTYGTLPSLKPRGFTVYNRAISHK